MGEYIISIGRSSSKDRECNERCCQYTMNIAIRRSMNLVKIYKMWPNVSTLSQGYNRTVERLEIIGFRPLVQSYYAK